MREYVGPTRQTTHVTFVPGDPPRLAAVAHQDASAQAVYLWRLDRPDATVLSWTQDTKWAEPVLTVSTDGRWLVAGTNEVIRLWDLSVEPPAGPVARPLSGVRAVWLTGPSDELTVLIVRGEGGPAQLLGATLRLSVRAGWTVRPVWLPLSEPSDLAYRVLRMSQSDWRLQAALSADGTRVALAPRELSGNPLARAAFVWDVGPGQPPRVIATSGHPCALSFSPDGSRLVIDVGTIYVYDTATHKVIGSWKAKWYDAPGLAWSPDGRLLARTDNSTTVRVYEAATGREVMAVGGKRGRLTSVAFSPDGLMLATGTHTGPIRVWDVE